MRASGLRVRWTRTVGGDRRVPLSLRVLRPDAAGGGRSCSARRSTRPACRADPEDPRRPAARGGGRRSPRPAPRPRRLRPPRRRSPALRARSFASAESIRVRFGCREDPAAAVPRLQVEIGGPRRLEFDADIARCDGVGSLELVLSPEGKARDRACGTGSPGGRGRCPVGARVTVLEEAAAAPLTARLRSFALPLDLELIQLDARARGWESAVDRLARSLRQGRGMQPPGLVAARFVWRSVPEDRGRTPGSASRAHVHLVDGGSGTFQSRWRHLGPGSRPPPRDLHRPGGVAREHRIGERRTEDSSFRPARVPLASRCRSSPWRSASTSRRPAAQAPRVEDYAS